MIHIKDLPNVRELNTTEMASIVGGINPQPEPPGIAAGFISPIVLVGFTPQPEPPGIVAWIKL
ncbi:MAG: hypothetical protein GY754_33845 [bacterium]|nr:hypothetical protein [bacterium]